MTALVLDAGVFVAVDRGDRSMLARLRVAERNGLDLRSNAVVVGQVWRDGQGRQARIARFLRAVDVRSVDDRGGREAGVLLGAAGTSDVIDATVVLLAEPGDRIVTSDPADVERLVAASGRRALVVAC
jgi:hypothetical protein